MTGEEHDCYFQHKARMEKEFMEDDNKSVPGAIRHQMRAQMRATNMKKHKVNFTMEGLDRHHLMTYGRGGMRGRRGHQRLHEDDDNDIPWQERQHLHHMEVEKERKRHQTFLLRKQREEAKARERARKEQAKVQKIMEAAVVDAMMLMQAYLRTIRYGTKHSGKIGPPLSPELIENICTAGAVTHNAFSSLLAQSVLAELQDINKTGLYRTDGDDEDRVARRRELMILLTKFMTLFPCLVSTGSLPLISHLQEMLETVLSHFKRRIANLNLKVPQSQRTRSCL